MHIPTGCRLVLIQINLNQHGKLGIRQNKSSGLVDSSWIYCTVLQSNKVQRVVRKEQEPDS